MIWSVLVLLWVSLFFMALDVPVCAVKYNVTVVGLASNWTVGLLPVVWRASGVVQVSVQNSTGECPVGRYCPAGTGVPLMCPIGTYSDKKKQVSPCITLCSIGWYCPDPGQRILCPTNTVSARGGKSQVDCRCNAGYQCVYKKHVNLNVGLGVPYRVWVSSEGDALKQALLQAVAEVAGVPLGSVRIDKVLPDLTLGGNSGASGGARRLLSTSKGAAATESAVLSMSVAGANAVNGLKERLRKTRAFKRGDIRVYWKLIENVRVLKRSAD